MMWLSSTLCFIYLRWYYCFLITSKLEGPLKLLLSSGMMNHLMVGLQGVTAWNIAYALNEL